MTILQRIKSGFRRRVAKGAAIAAAAAIGFTAMGDEALARGQHADAKSGSLTLQFAPKGVQLAHGGHGGYGKYKTRCVAKAFRRNGRKLKGTRGVGVRKFERRACRAAMRECRHRLDYKRHKTGRHFPYARCEVTKVKRVAVDKHRHHNHGYNHHYGPWGGIVFKF